MVTAQVSLPLPVLPEGWSAPSDFKAIGTLSTPNQRNLEPVGPHFLAHARRVSISPKYIYSPHTHQYRYRDGIRANQNVQKRHKRTFSEDERIQAQENVKKVEDEDGDDISEPENELMLGRDAKDWKVCLSTLPFSPSPSLAYIIKLQSYDTAHIKHIHSISLL